jgi:dihydrofolate reductase
MARLIYSALASLDGYTADEAGNFDWAAPDEDVHAFVNDLERPIGTYLLGRRMYDVMTYWETADTLPDQSAIEQDYARIWKAADKVVYSRTLDAVSGERTRIERDFDPDAVRQMKESAGHDISVGGPGLAAEALRAGLVDELQLFLNPVVVGGGTRALPDGVHLQLDLLAEHRFANGVIYLRYGVRSDSAARTASA